MPSRASWLRIEPFQGVTLIARRHSALDVIDLLDRGIIRLTGRFIRKPPSAAANAN